MQEYLMSKNLYVGNLSYNVTESQIRELFAQAGNITEVKVIMDRDTGRSKGFAFVQMSDNTEAQNAIRRFNGYSMDNRVLNVNEARPREERSGNGGFGDDNRNRRY
jgi:cold-inducible RNA-binding protein